MAHYFWYRTCPLCRDQGRLLVFKNTSELKLYLHCEECEWGWADPESAHSKELGFLTLDEDFEAMPAGASDIKEFGWTQYALNEFDDG